MYHMIGDNLRFERAALKILLLKDPRCCRMMFGDEYNYLTIYAYAIGIASVVHDSRILEAISYRKDSESDNLRKGPMPTESEKLHDFFEFFNDSILNEIRKYDCKNRLLLRKLDYTREKSIVQSAAEEEHELDEVKELLIKIPNSYTGFIMGTLAAVKHSHIKRRRLISFINDHPEAGPSEIVEYTMDEIGIVKEGQVAELERYVDFGIEIDEADYDCLGKWLCISNPITGYGLFSKDTWASEELLPILERYV